MDIKKGLVATLTVAIWIFTHWLAGGLAIAATSSKTKQNLSQELYRVSGLSKEKNALSKKRMEASILIRSRILQSLGLSTEHITLLNNIYKGTFNANNFYSRKLKKIINSYHMVHMTQSIRFFRSAAGRKVVSLNLKSLKVSQKTYQKFLEKVVKTPPKKNRINLFDQLEKAMGLVDEVIDLETTVLRLTNPVNKEFSAPHAETLVSRLQSDLREQLRSLILLESMYNYRFLFDRELQKLIQFYESSAGQWFRKLDREGNLAGFATINRKALRHMKKILKVVESGHQNIQTARVVFAPGLRHLFSENRDPFVPLIVPGEEDKKKKARSDGKSHEEAIRATIGGLPAIPFELYQRIKESNPRLYSDIEYYGALFKNIIGLSRMKSSKFEEKIIQYKSLIAKARKETELLVQTPLQASLGSLTLAGVIWDEKETIGLIETPDTKGHAIRVGSFIGPNLGVVQSIDEERVVVREQLRKYDGGIVTRTEFIEFPHPDE